MPVRYRFEALNATHDLSSFRSGSGALDLFLHREALLEQENDRSRTFVLLPFTAEDSAEYVVGYYTLKAEGIWSTGLPGSSDPPAYLPVAELAFLARHRELRGERLGDVLLIEALRCVVEAAQWIGIAGISLYASTEGMLLYERFGFLRFGERDRRMFLPLADARAALGVMQP